ncbi:MAG: tail fiber domain-containing protein [Minisyncoccota bacterium]
MALESAIYISQLVSTNPTGADQKAQGDDHIRLIKAVLQNTFPNISAAITATAAEINKLAGATLTTTELNYVAGATSAIQTQLNTKASLAANTFTADQIINGLEIGRGGGNLVSNAAFGDTALDSNTTGANNTALGGNALTANTSGSSNTATGFNTLAANTTGIDNTATGSNALQANTTGDSNVAVGRNALLGNTTGFNNTAVGSIAAEANSTGNGNVAVGRGAAFRNSTGSSNTAVGTHSLFDNTSSSGNTAIGADALSIVTAANNTAIGSSAGTTLTTGSNNSLIGQNAQPSANGISNEITLGNALITTLRCQVTTITALSDVRDKKDIIDIPLGLSFINALRPVKFTWARRDGTKEGVQEAGFIAQELDNIQLSFNAENYMHLVHKANPEKLEATPGNLLPVLVKAIQELKAEFDAYKLAHP